ncbi:MAG TPA: cbb3-type cytochrome c oxidase subunit I [Candidatus Acidoferrales bacterium]|nr:cbb3-type cytochrome c oxidase subunit I [Candidatus Acidoferrales bacterium]
MTTEAGAVHVHEAPHGFIRKYIFSLDHKVIGKQYIFLALFSAFVGMFLSLLMRLRLAWPGMHIPFFPDGILPEQYLALMTMHGTIMVFMVLTTAPQSGFGNFFLPIQIGAADMAFPVLNMLSFWTTFLSLTVLLAAFFVTGGAPLGGWTVYTPLSAIGATAGPGQGTGMTLWVVAIAIFSGASLMGAINFIATTLDLRTRGLSLMRLPLTAWSWFITAVISLLAFGVLLAAGILLLLDRTAGTSFFIPGNLVLTEKVIPHKGGSPILWQHLFWFFGHPEVYIAILPGMGVTSHVISTFSRKPIFGYRAMVFALAGIAFLGFVVWGHHMFVSGMSPYVAIAFSILTMSIGVPSAIKTFNWIGTLWNADIKFTTPMLFALGFVSLFVTGGLSGLFLAQPSIDLYLTDTYFVVAHFHLIMGVAAIFGIFTATYFWFPKMFGRMLHDGMGKVHFWFSFIGVYAIFMPMHFLGLAGHPRRYVGTEGAAYLGGLEPIHVFVSVAAVVTITAQLIFLFNFFWSMWKGKKADINPWHATTLEWSVPAPVPHDNFGGHEPRIYRGPYEFSVPGMTEDYLPQYVPAEKEVKG